MAMDVYVGVYIYRALGLLILSSDTSLIVHSGIGIFLLMEKFRRHIILNLLTWRSRIEISQHYMIALQMPENITCN